MPLADQLDDIRVDLSDLKDMLLPRIKKLEEDYTECKRMLKVMYKKNKEIVYGKK
jgi:hypothetical protein